MSMRSDGSLAGTAGAGATGDTGVGTAGATGAAGVGPAGAAGVGPAGAAGVGPAGAARVGARVFRAVGAVLLVGPLAGACGRQPQRGAAPVPVTVAVAERRAAPFTITANGVVEPLQTVAVEPQVNGIVTSVDFAEGDDVRAGQPLFHIDARPYEAALQQAEATLARDAAQAENSRRDAERYRTLVKQDYVTQAQADQAAATAVAQAAAVKADSAAVRTARLNLAYTVIRAPIAGRTGSLLVHEGNVARATGSPLVVINQIRPILVRFPVAARDFPEVQRHAAGRALPVSVAVAEGDQGDPITGELSFVDNAVDPQTGTVLLKARFANERSLLWPGEYVTASLQLYVEQGAIVVPASAIIVTQTGSSVFVVDSAEVAHQRDITPGRPLADQVIVAAGVQAGERVVTDGQSRLADGDRVVIRTVPAAAPGATEEGAAR